MPPLAAYLSAVAVLWYEIVQMAGNDSLANYGGSVEAAVAWWLGAGLIPYAVLQLALFASLYTDKKHESDMKCMNERMDAMEADRRRDAERMVAMEAELKTLKAELGRLRHAEILS